MSDHGSVQAVLGHHGAAAPALLLLPPLGSAVLEPYLHQEGNSSISGGQMQRFGEFLDLIVFFFFFMVVAKKSS